MENNILFCNKCCIYDNNENSILIYGHYTNKFINIYIENIQDYEVVFNYCRPDFFIKLKNCSPNDTSIIKTIHFNYGCFSITQTDISLEFPFENCKIELLKDRSAIITTMCKDYSHRLDEWIQYNLKLGFSGIIIFDNSLNTKNPLNETLKNCCNERNMREITDKYKEKVFLVDFPYSPFDNEHWNNIQRITLSLGVKAFKNKCKYISLIDADEFYYLPENPRQSIEDFLNIYSSTIISESNVITNTNNDDIINNNIIKLCEYIGDCNFTKVILDTNTIHDEFIVSPHDYQSYVSLPKEKIIHYHAWVNSRYEHLPSMPKTGVLQEFFYN